VASKSEPRKKWKQLCHGINTSEIDYGSRWFQEDPEDDDGDLFEERFLVKWSDLSYLHCSWETEDDLIDQVDGAKTYLTTFFRKSENGLLFTADERCDGDYFDPAYVQIERILEVHLPDNVPKKSKNYGIVMDKADPKFESGTGRQFLIKWSNTPYSDATYEFERDLILNEVDYQEYVDAFFERSKKPLLSKVKKNDTAGDLEERRLYKIFGDKIHIDEELREPKVKEYQMSLANTIFPNGGQLRDYQAEGVAWLMSNHVNHRSSILADEMGLGKTIQTAVYVNHVATTLKQRGPFLIVAPLSTIPHWHREFSSWTKLNTIVYHGSAKNREVIREFEMAYEVDRPKSGVAFNQSYLRKCLPPGSRKKRQKKPEAFWMVDVVITTPEMLVTDDFSELTAIEWDILVVDEAHRLKNHASKLAHNLRDDRFTFKQKLLLTGTPIQNNMTELWTLMNIVDEAAFGDMDDFIDRYGDMKSKERIDELHEGIRPYILRRLKEDVEKSVPPKEETLIEVELTIPQKQYYRALYEKNVQFLHRNKKKALDGPSINNLAMQLRKCCNHPFLLNGVEEDIRSQEKKSGSQLSEGDFLVKASGKLVLLDKLLPKLKENGHRILIFSQFKIMLDILEDYLHARTYKHERIDGSITGNKRQMAIDRFQSKNTDNDREQPFIMLLSTRAGGVGINLTAADTCIIFDSDWNPQNDLQAQARCHRIGQTKNVKVYRLLSRKTYEMQMFHMSSLKMGLDQAVLQGFEKGESGGGEGAMTKEEVERLLRHGAYDIFNEEKSGAADAESNEFVQQDIDSILERRSKTVIHENTGSKSSAAGGTFSKASFKAPKTPDGGSKKSSNEDVDIDDPEFWKKMVGEGKVEDDATDLAGKKRKRTQTNYSERDYDRRLTGTLGRDGSDSDSASSSNESDSGQDGWSDDEEEALVVDDYEGGTVGRTKRARRKKEKTRWGGSGPTEWEKDDVLKVFKALQTYGYGNLPWEEFSKKMDISKEGKYSMEEIKRMCWSLIFVVLRDSADEDATGARKRAEKAAKKKRESEGKATPPPSPSKGGILGASSTGQDVEGALDLLAAKQETFLKLWAANSAWISQLVQDAQEYSRSNESRSNRVFEHAMSGENKKPLRTKKEEWLLSAMNQNLWGQLKSRGWTSRTVMEGKYAGQTHYLYEKRQYRSPQAVLAAIPTIHMELSTVVDQLLANSAAVEKEHENALLVEAAKATLNPVSRESLSLFLKLYAPLQLMFDRNRARRMHLSRKVLGACSALHAADTLVKQCKANEGKGFYDQLARHLHVDRRTALPHPSWTPRHDAILVAAIAKHGWIDHDVSCRAITNDSSIRWGAPFDDGIQDTRVVQSATEPISKEELRRKELSSKLLRDTANRAAMFFNAEYDMIQELKGFNQNLVKKAYGLTQQQKDENEDSAVAVWVVDDALLKQAEDGAYASQSDDNDDEEKAEELAELPTKKDLLKRAKTVLSRSVSSLTAGALKPEGTGQDGEKQEPPPQITYKYSVLNQGDHCNILLAEMLRGLMKANFVAKKGSSTNATTMCRKLCAHASQEARRRCDTIEGLVEPSKDDSSIDPAQSFCDEMVKITKHIEQVSRHIKAASRPAKNILRVVLGIPPVTSKNSTSEDLFPSEKKKPLTITKITEKPPPRKKRKSDSSDKKKNENHASGDRAISRGMYRAQKNGAPREFKDIEDQSVLRLAAIETLLLSVVCSQGLPVWTANWHDIIRKRRNVIPEKQGPGCQYAITWFGMGIVVQSAAEVWYESAKAKLQERKELLKNKLVISDGKETAEIVKIREKIAVCELDERIKRRAYAVAMDFHDDPKKLAKKCIMLLECVRRRMGSVEKKKGGGSKKSGLGSKVLKWTSKELARWGDSLDILDGTGKVLAHTTASFLENLPRNGGEEELYVCSILDKKACLSVFSQIAQQTRTRSIFLKYTDEELEDVFGKALKKLISSEDTWHGRPSWWGDEKDDSGGYSSFFDLELLSGLLEYGFSGFEEMIEKKTEFYEHLKKKGDGEDVILHARARLTRAAAQERVNQLSRELNSVDETEMFVKMVIEKNRPLKVRKIGLPLGNMANVVGDASSGSGAQAVIEAFFGKPQPASKKEVIVLSDSDEAGGKCIDLVSSSTSKASEEVADATVNKEPTTN